MAIKSSHNTMTYRKPLQWWLRPLAFTARCQSRDYELQDVDGFDLRLYWDKNGYPIFKHGFFSYYGRDIFDVLAYADENKMAVRLMLENRSFLNKEVEMRGFRLKFREFCQESQKFYLNIRFHGGRDLYTWEVLYDFGWEPKTADLYSSQDRKAWYKKLNGLWPWLWSRFHNRKVLKRLSTYPDSTVVLYDFV